MKAIPSLTAVLLALALPGAGAERPGTAAGGPTGLTPTADVIIDSPPVDLADGGTGSWGVHVENNGASPLPGPLTIDIETFGLANGTWTQAGWTCTFAPPTATCAWPSDVPPGGTTGTVAVAFDVVGPYAEELACGGERAPCVWFQAGLAPDLDRVFTSVVVGGNTPPVAGHDTFYTRPGAPAPLTGRILDNDADADGHLLVAEIVDAPAHGTATLDPATGELGYTPGPTYGGLDILRYLVRDGFGGTDTAFVTIRELPGTIAFDRTLVDVGQVEIAHVAAKFAYLLNNTGVRLEGTITVGPVPAAEVSTVLVGTGYDPSLVAFDPAAFRPVDGQSYATLNADVTNFTILYVRPLPPLGTIWLARLTYHLHPAGSPDAVVSASIDVVARSATAAEAPLHVFPDVITVPADTATILRPLANDDSAAGNPLSVTAIFGSDPWLLDPDSAVGLFDYADAQGPNGTLPYLGILYTPPPGYTGTNAAWYAASEVVFQTVTRLDFAKITLHVAAVPPPPVAVASGDATLCAGGSAPLTGSGGVSCAWSPAAGLSDAASCTPTASPAATTTYSLVVTDAFGRTSTNTAAVTVTVDAPQAAAAGSTTIALGQSAPLTGSGGVSCAWSPAAGLDDAGSCTPTASPTLTTTYALVVTSAAGCASTNTATATITVVPAGLADLVVAGLAAPNQVRQGDTATATVVVRNDGAAGAAATLTRVYLSADAVLDAGDTALASAAQGPLGVGQAEPRTVTITVPSVAPGQYYLIAAADDGQAVAESNEGNNTLTSRIHVKRDRP